MLASEAGTTSQTLSSFENGQTNRIQPRIWQRIAEVFSLSVEDLNRHVFATGDDLAAEVEKMRHEAESAPPGVAIQTITDSPAAPCYDAAVAACEWLPISEVYAVDTRREARMVDRGEFCVRVQGDCMETRWPNASTVRFKIVRLDREGWPQGEDCLLIHSDDKVTFKNLYHVDDDTVTLYARNLAKYPEPILVPKQMITRVAVAMKIEWIPPKEPLKVNGGKSHKKTKR
jgi:SOS-response transcriptional repressor LexA